MSRTAAVLLATLLPSVPVRAQGAPHDTPEPVQATADSLEALRARLDRDPFFKTVNFDEEHRDPFVFLIRKPDRPIRNYRQRIVEFYLPWLEALVEEWNQEFIEPLAIPRRPDYSRYVMMVLKSRGDYLNLAQAHRSQDLYAARALYLPELRLAVTYEDVFGSGNGDREQLQAALHEMVHALQHSCSASDTLSGPGLNEGLAEYFSNPALHKTSVREFQHLNTDALRDLLFILRVPELRRLLLFSPGELLAVTSYGNLLERVRARGGAALPDPGQVMATFYAQAGLLVYYANEGDGGRYRADFQDYVSRVLRNEVDAWSSAFPSPRGEELARDFEAFLERETRKRASPVGAAAPAVAPGPPTPPPPHPELLRVAQPGEELRLALALERAARGELRAAIQDATKVQGNRDAPEWSARAAREIPRLQDLVRLREEFLEAWPRAKNLVLEVEGEQVFGKLLDVGKDSLQLQSTQRGQFQVPVAALSPRLLAETILDKKLPLGEPPALAYGLALGSDAEWSRVLSGVQSAEELRQDLADLPRLLRMARAARRLDALAEAGLPADEAAAQALLARTRPVLGEQDLDLVAARAEELRRLCRAAFAVLAQGREEEFLATRVKPRISADGTWELVYEFSSPEELEDFRPADQDNSFIEYQAAPLLRGPAPPPRLYNGALILRGDRPLRHVLDFAAPLEIELVSSTVSYPDASVESTLYVVLCDDGYGSYALSSQVGNLYVLDKASGYQDSDQEPLQLFFDIKYHLRLVHDGTTLSSFLDGQSNRSVAAGGRTHGAVLLWPYSDTDQAVHRLVIRSKLDPAFLQRRKDEWIDAQMKELDPGPGGDGR